jgi:hypothetical protein
MDVGSIPSGASYPLKVRRWLNIQELKRIEELMQGSLAR